MGYFSNSDEGVAYEAEWCSKCVHYGTDGTRCAVLGAHVLFAYGAKGEAEQILGELIPRRGIRNLKCRMFVTVEDLTRKRRERANDQRAVGKLPGVE